MIGGLAFFFFGLSNARHGLQLAAGERLRLLMGRLAHNRFFAVGLGALVTTILQSSSATTVILVSFAETQLLTLSQAFGVVLGSGIGTTLVVILLSFKKITQYALLLVALGIAMERLARRQQLRYIGSVVLGFGLIFFGMNLMSGAAVPLRESPLAMSAFGFLAKNPFWSLVFAAIFTAVIQVSAATIGLAIALAHSGALTFEAAIPIVLGANVGTCITAALACLGMGVEGRRVAAAHVMAKAIGAAIVFPFIHDIAAWMGDFDGFFVRRAFSFSLAAGGKIALTHLSFNVLLAAVFLPFIEPFVWVVKKIIPESHRAEEFGPKYLDEAALDTPPLAFAQAKRELMRIAKMSHRMFADVLDLFRNDVDFDKLVEEVGAADDRVDMLEKKVRFYLAKVSQKALTESQAANQVALITIGGEFEDIGDAVSKEMTSLAHKRRKKLALFSEEGWSELKHLHSLVMENFGLAISMLMQPHQDIAMKAMRHEKYLNEVEQELRQSHLLRLHEKLPETFETSTIHLDLLSQFRMINSKLTKVVEIARELR